ncbi:MAG: helix-turn-helix domain-containing protein [Gulosibacter sp.]|uniref:helix-turn-helix domain-containing protein n=1 Tax=Gulosibacter sp. TaxID=2817531 RepID=UPI003F8F0384
MKGVAHSAEDLGEVVRTIRHTHGMSQVTLAERLGVSQRYLSELERGKPKILDEQYFGVLTKLGIKIFYEVNDGTAPPPERK